MKNIYTVIVIAMFLTACRDNMDIEILSAEAKIAAYCMPSTADTTFIKVVRSVPISKYSNASEIKTLSDATIEYKVNGTRREVVNAGDGTYYVVGKQKEGDKIDLKIESNGLKTVSASTTIPPSVETSNVKMLGTTVYDNDFGTIHKSHQLQFTFTDNTQTHDYYAVCVRARGYQGVIDLYRGKEKERLYSMDDYIENFSHTAYDSVVFRAGYSKQATVSLVTKDEPLLNSLSDLDEFFGFEEYNHDHFYIFDDALLNGKPYTMRLTIEPNWFSWNFTLAEFCVEMCRITPEYYNFIKALNSLPGNFLATYGLSQIAPTEGNLKDGIGMVGGCNCTRSEWINYYGDHINNFIFRKYDPSEDIYGD